MGYAATDWQREIVTSLNYLKKQIECIQRRGCLCFGHPTDLTYDAGTGRLTARFVDNSERSVALDIPRSLSHLQLDRDISAVIDTVQRLGKWYYAITITDLNGNAHVLEFEKVENTSQLQNDGENGTDRFFSNANWKFHSHVLGKVDKGGTVSMETDSPIATVMHDGVLSEIKESLTSIRLNEKNLYLLEYIDENGKLTQLDLSWLILDASYEDMASPKHRVGHLTIASMAHRTGRAKQLVDADINETVTSLQLDADRSVLLYRDEVGTAHRIPLKEGLGLTALYIPSKRPSATSRIGSLTIIQNGVKLLDDAAVEETVTSLRIDPGAKDLEYFDERGVMTSVPLDFLAVNATIVEPSSSTHPIATLTLAQGDDTILNREIKETVTSLTRAENRDILLFKDETGHINEIPLISIFSVANLQYKDVTKGRREKIGALLYDSAKGPVQLDVFETIPTLTLAPDGKTLMLTSGERAPDTVDLTGSVKKIVESEDLHAKPFIDGGKVKFTNGDSDRDAKPFELGSTSPLSNLSATVMDGHTIATVEQNRIAAESYGGGGKSNMLLSSQPVAIQETVTSLSGKNREENPYLLFRDERGDSNEILYPTFVQDVRKEADSLVVRKSDGSSSKVNMESSLILPLSIKKNGTALRTSSVVHFYDMAGGNMKDMCAVYLSLTGNVTFHILVGKKNARVRIAVNLESIDLPYNLLYKGERKDTKVASYPDDSWDSDGNQHDVRPKVSGGGETSLTATGTFIGDVNVPLQGISEVYYVEWIHNSNYGYLSIGDVPSATFSYNVYADGALYDSGKFTLYNV